MNKNKRIQKKSALIFCNTRLHAPSYFYRSHQHIISAFSRGDCFVTLSPRPSTPAPLVGGVHWPVRSLDRPLGKLLRIPILSYNNTPKTIKQKQCNDRWSLSRLVLHNKQQQQQHSRSTAAAQQQHSSSTAAATEASKTTRSIVRSLYTTVQRDNKTARNSRSTAAAAAAAAVECDLEHDFQKHELLLESFLQHALCNLAYFRALHLLCTLQDATSTLLQRPVSSALSPNPKAQSTMLMFY